MVVNTGVAAIDTVILTVALLIAAGFLITTITWAYMGVAFAIPQLPGSSFANATYELVKDAPEDNGEKAEYFGELFLLLPFLLLIAHWMATVFDI